MLSSVTKESKTQKLTQKLADEELKQDKDVSGKL
jgi:hypothetical protein